MSRKNSASCYGLERCRFHTKLLALSRVSEQDDCSQVDLLYLMTDCLIYDPRTIFHKTRVVRLYTKE
jgi:hypothetical protein